MAVTFATGFEAQLAALDNVSFTGTAAYSTAQARTGTASVRCNPASGASGYVATSVTSQNYMHFGLYIASLPSVDRIICGFTGAGNPNVRLSSTGTLSFYADTTLVGTSAALATGVWYWIGVKQTSGTSTAFLQINGVDAVTGTASISPLGVVGARSTEASAIDIYIDDIIGDGAGFIESANVGLLTPISDATVTGVTDNNGVTTNIYDCVNNIPPTGVASANEAANPKTGMHFPASTVCTYTTNFATYASLGMQATDSVLAVRSVIRHGEDITTGTKNGTLGAVSNPTISDSIAFTFGNDGTAHAAESGANFWFATFGTLTTSPTVTAGTSPTLTVTRASETRLGCMDFMGLLVVWRPRRVEFLHYASIVPD